MGRDSGGGGGGGGFTSGGGFEKGELGSGAPVLSTKPYQVRVRNAPGSTAGSLQTRRITIEEVNYPEGKYEIVPRLGGFDRERGTGVRPKYANKLSEAKRLATAMASNIPDALYKLP